MTQTKSTYTLETIPEKLEKVDVAPEVNNTTSVENEKLDDFERRIKELEHKEDF